MASIRCALGRRYLTAFAALSCTVSVLPIGYHSLSLTVGRPFLRQAQDRLLAAIQTVAGHNNSTAPPIHPSLPLGFEPNRGQGPDQARFIAHGGGYALAISSTAATFHLLERCPALHDKIRYSRRPPLPILDAPHSPQQWRDAMVSMRLLGANAKAAAEGIQPLLGASNYFIGNDPTKWRTTIPHYAKVKFARVYDGVDLVYYGTDRGLEYDFILTPGADPGKIRIAFSGAEQVEVDAQGGLAVSTSGGMLLNSPKPAVYQERNGKRQSLEGRYVIHSGGTQRQWVGVEVAGYDRNPPARH